MKRTVLNFRIDILAFILFGLLATTGLVLAYLLPPGSGGSLTLWGVGRHQWGDFHFYISLCLMAVIVLHLFLHWSWVSAMAKGQGAKGHRVRLVVASIALMAFLILLASPFLTGTREAGGRKSEHTGRSH